VLERVVKHAKTAPPDVRRYNPAVPAALWDVCRRMLAKRPADRYQTPAELLIALTELSDLLSEVEARPEPAGRRVPPAPARLRGRSARETLAMGQAQPTTEGMFAATSSAGQRQVALEQYQHATQALASGNYDYGLALLLTCCQLAPGDLSYRQALRQAQLERYELSARRPWRLAPLRWLYRLRLALACRRRQPLRVLACGEELLCCDPHDLPTQLTMAEAAAAAELPELAIWLLEHARGSAPGHLPLLRSLAHLYEKQEDVGHAKQVCEAILRLDEGAGDTRRQLQRLLVSETSVALRASGEPRAARGGDKVARRLIT
jgi:predicted Zn-dependent protease